MPRTADSTVLSRISVNAARVLRETGMSARQWAAKAGVSHSVVNGMLKEEREPSVSTLEKLCAAANIGITEILAAKSTPTKRVKVGA